MPFSCRSALQRLGAKPSVRVPPTETATPTSPQSMSSSPGLDEMSYIDFKLKQYQIKVEQKESKEPTAPVRNFALKVKTKLGSLYQGKTEKRVAAYNRGYQFPRRKIVFGSKRTDSSDPRHALEVTETQRPRVESEVALEDIRLEFSTKSNDDSSVQGLLSLDYSSRNSEKGPQGLVKDGPTYHKPTVEDADSVESHHGVIVLEAQGLEAIQPRDLVV